MADGRVIPLPGADGILLGELARVSHLEPPLTTGNLDAEQTLGNEHRNGDVFERSLDRAAVAVLIDLCAKQRPKGTHRYPGLVGQRADGRRESKGLLIDGDSRGVGHEPHEAAIGDEHAGTLR